MENVLRISVSAADFPNEEWRAERIVAYDFALMNDGRFVITELWTDSDESYAAYNDIEVPARVWREAWPWIVARMNVAA